MMLLPKRLMLWFVSFYVLLGMAGCKTCCPSAAPSGCGLEKPEREAPGAWSQLLRADDWVKEHVW